MAYIGIDPGKKGAIARIANNGRITTWVMPLTHGNDIALFVLCELIDRISSPKDTVALELIHSIYGTSKGSMFTMGRGLGNLESTLACKGCNFHYVRPADWQARIWIDKDMVKKPSKSGKKMVNDTKAISLNAAKRIFPKTDMKYGNNEKRHKGRTRIKEHDGIVDALLIAQYARFWLKIIK
jgi:hypothetical protein